MMALRIKYENVYEAFRPLSILDTDNDQGSLRFVEAHLRRQVSVLLLKTVF